MNKFEAARERARTSVMSAFKNERGAFDLASIMVGVTVIAIMTLGVVAIVFAVIPWAQDNAAKGEVQAVVTAEAAYYTQDLGGDQLYGDLAALVGQDLISPSSVDDGNIIIFPTGTSGQTAGFTTYVLSDSGNVFMATDLNPEPIDSGLDDALPATLPEG